MWFIFKWVKVHLKDNMKEFCVAEPHMAILMSFVKNTSYLCRWKGQFCLLIIYIIPSIVHICSYCFTLVQVKSHRSLGLGPNHSYNHLGWLAKPLPHSSEEASQCGGKEMATMPNLIACKHGFLLESPGMLLNP